MLFCEGAKKTVEIPVVLRRQGGRRTFDACYPGSPLGQGCIRNPKPKEKGETMTTTTARSNETPGFHA